MKYIKTFESHLTYDEIDLDYFLRKYIVGRNFASEKEALNYLEDRLQHDDKSRTLNDFNVVDTNDNTLKPYKIYPLPSDIELNRNKASKLLKKYGFVRDYYPMYAYMEYRHIDKLKELGVRYTFKPLKEISLTDVLGKYFKNIKIDGVEFERIYDSPLSTNNHSTVIELYLSGSTPKSDVMNIYKKVMSIVDEFNGKIGSGYEKVGLKLLQSDSSLRKGLKKLLDDDKHSNYNPNDSIKDDKEYKKVFIILERIAKEEEFLAVVDMESRDKPNMIKR